MTHAGGEHKAISDARPIGEGPSHSITGPGRPHGPGHSDIPEDLIRDDRVVAFTPGIAAAPPGKATLQPVYFTRGPAARGEHE